MHNNHKSLSKKILIIRFSSIGDIVLTTPVIRCLKEQLPGVELHFLTKKANENILSSNPYIDELHFLKDGLYNTAKLIKDQKYDLIIDLHNNIRSRFISLFCGVKTIRFNKANVAKWLKVNLKIDVLPNRHLIGRYFEALQSLNLKNDNKGLDFFIEPGNQFEHPFLKKPYIAIAVGAKHFTKRIPPEKIIHLIKKIDSNFVLLGDKNDALSAQIITNQFPSKTLNLCGTINLQQSASVIQNAKAVITGDTALMHIAAAFNKPVFSVWGNTIPQFGMYPYIFKDEQQLKPINLNIYENNNLDCRPCSKIGHNKCPKTHFSCMMQLNFNKLINDINLLSEKRK